MFEARLVRSPRKDKKWRMIFLFNGNKLQHTDFGAPGYEDYTTHRDDQRKTAFLNRFRTLLEEKDYNFTAPIILSRYILWNKPTIRASLADFKRKYHLK